MTRLAAAIGGVLLLVAFVLLGLAAAPGPIGPDATVARTLRGEYREPLGGIAEVVSVLLGPLTAAVTGLALVITAVLAWRRGQRRTAETVSRGLLVGGLCWATAQLKPVFDRERPRDYPDLSYPSGHVVAVSSTAFVLILLCVLLARHLVRRVLVVALAAVAVCAASRMVLTVHWLTDTLGAVLAVGGVGLLASVLLGLINRAGAPPDRRSARPAPGR